MARPPSTDAGKNAPIPRSDTDFKPVYRSKTPGTVPGPPEQPPGATAMEAVGAFRKRVQHTVQNATPQFRNPDSKGY